MKIQVTQRHIDRGQRRNRISCPIARAIEEVVLPHTFIRVGGRIMEVGAKSFKLSARMQQFVGRFDEGKNVEPFEFEIELSEGDMR